VDIPLSFRAYDGDLDKAANLYTRPWWHDFDDSALTKSIETAFDSNLNLAAAWSRLAQVAELGAVVGSSRFPQVAVEAGASRSRLENSKATLTDGTIVDLTQYSSNYIVQNGLSYEVDLWGRITSQVRAQGYRIEASRADAENTALLIAGTMTELWFRAQEQQALLDLLEEQIGVNRTLLELTELRMSLGRGSAVDVLQQRQQLVATESEVPIVKNTLEQTQNQLAALLGKTPNEFDASSISGAMPALPKLPEMVAPLDLLETRPDLRASLSRIQAAEYDIAEAVADRFPTLRLGLSYDFSATRFADIFSQQLATIIGSTALPIVDGGRRRAEVRRRKAAVQELSSLFGQSYLDAIIELENALVQEKRQIELLSLLEKRIQISKATLDETRARYMNGLSDYLPVILALQARQNLERRQIVEQRALLVARSRLYRAIGGQWTDSLQIQSPLNGLPGADNNMSTSL
jgi:NodT family efflux transporter outer membrane factor (OMF) lipoprotein